MEVLHIFWLWGPSSWVGSLPLKYFAWSCSAQLSCQICCSLSGSRRNSFLFAAQPFCCNPGVWQTDRQTDGRQRYRYRVLRSFACGREIKWNAKSENCNKFTLKYHIALWIGILKNYCHNSSTYAMSTMIHVSNKLTVFETRKSGYRWQTRALLPQASRG